MIRNMFLLTVAAMLAHPSIVEGKAFPVYVEIELEGMSARPYRPNNKLPQVQQEIATIVIQQMLKEGLDLDFPWNFQPAAPGGGQFPTLTIQIRDRKIGNATDNWLMSLHLDTGPNQGDFRKQFPVVDVLEQGMIAQGRAPDEDDRKQRVYEWFRDHFALKDGADSLRHTLKRNVPLAEGQVWPQNTNPPVQAGAGVVLLKEQFYGKLRNLTVEFQCAAAGGRLLKWIASGEGWFTQVITNNGPQEGIVVRHHPPHGVNLAGLASGKVYYMSSDVASGDFLFE